MSAILKVLQFLHRYWCQEVDCNQSDQVDRYIKRIEKTEEFMDSVLQFAVLAEEKVKHKLGSK